MPSQFLLLTSFTLLLNRHHKIAGKPLCFYCVGWRESLRFILALELLCHLSFLLQLLVNKDCLSIEQAAVNEQQEFCLKCWSSLLGFVWFLFVCCFFLNAVEYFMYLHKKQGAHCQMPRCFSYLQFWLQYFHLPDMGIFRASLPMDTRVSRWESGTLWYDGPDPVDHTLVLLCPSSYGVCNRGTGQPKANSLARWHVLLLHPTLLSRQPLRETSQARRTDGGERRTGGVRGPCSTRSLHCQAVRRRRRQRNTPKMSFPGCVAWAGEKQMLGSKRVVQSSQESARLGDGRPPRQ